MSSGATAIPGFLPGRRVFLVYAIQALPDLTDPLPRNKDCRFGRL